MKKRKKKFKLVDAILGTVCLTLVCESVMPTAALGNTQYFWWILLLICFCVPYGMITAELETTYPSKSNMYDWVKKAFGPKWAGRVAWNHWINFPLWISSLAVAVTDIVAGMFNIELSILSLLCLQLLFVWIVTFLSTKKIEENKYVINLGTFFKILLLLGTGILGIYTLIKTGYSENPITKVNDLIPKFNLEGLSFVSIILFSFVGFDVIGTWTENMKNPKKEVPKAILLGSLLMTLFYVLPATSFNIALKHEVITKINPENLIEVLNSLLSTIGLGDGLTNVLVIVAGFMLIYTFIANIASWASGINEVARYTAEDKAMPKVFKKVNDEGVPYMAAIINGLVASIICIVGIIVNLISKDEVASFSLFFQLSWITLLISYGPIFLAFLKLRKTDKTTKRIYKVPGNPIIMAIIPFIILVLGIIFTLFGNFSKEFMLDRIPLYVGIIISFVLEELIVLKNRTN